MRKNNPMFKVNVSRGVYHVVDNTNTVYYSTQNETQALNWADKLYKLRISGKEVSPIIPSLETQDKGIKSSNAAFEEIFGQPAYENEKVVEPEEASNEVEVETSGRNEFLPDMEIEESEEEATDPKEGSNNVQ